MTVQVIGVNVARGRGTGRRAMPPLRYGMRLTCTPGAPSGGKTNVAMPTTGVAARRSRFGGQRVCWNTNLKPIIGYRYGSDASRSPSPRKLNIRTVITTNMHGTSSHEWWATT